MNSETAKNYINQLIAKALNSLYSGQNFGEFLKLSVPEAKFGDYSTNLALVLSKKIKQNPKEITAQLIEKIKQFGAEDILEDVSEAGGFVNFKLSQDYLTKNLGQILEKKENFGSSQKGQGQKILVEYFQPNIAKPLHLGHLRTAIIGDCLFRLFKFCGFNPESDTHLGDWGTQFGLLLHGYKKYGDISIIQKDPIKELNKLYVKINLEAENNLSVREAGKAEFTKLEKGDKENRELWQKFKEWSWQEFEVIYTDLEIRRADHDWPESFFENLMPKVLSELRKKGLLKESQGAQIVDLEAYGLGVALVVKSDGGTTYLLRDLATYIYRKSQGFEKQFYVVDVRQTHTLSQTFKILELMGHITSKEEAIHVAYGFLTLPEGAMSTRKGTTVGAKEFIQGVEESALAIIKEKNPELSNKEKVAKIVAVAAIKYSDLSHNVKSDIVFDPKKAISFEGNTGPYLQYTHARIHGILRKGNREEGINQPSTFNPHELAVLRKLYKFPEIVEAAAEDLQPNIITNYLFGLSQSFNSFYQEVPVLQETDEAKKSFRLQLITATAQVIKNGLSLLGIEAPEEM
jgi:arginyl-tRNA synthetase